MKNINHRSNTDAPSAWTKNAHIETTKRNFMGHFDAVRAGLVLLQEEVLGSGRQCVRRGGCDVCLQP
jgi:hypothetical protein